MKIIITTLLVGAILMFTCCKENTKEQLETALPTSKSIGKEKKVVKTKQNQILKQHGDYSQLFKRDLKDCSFISAEILATALQVSSTMIEQSNNGCTFHLTEENGNKTRLYFKLESWGNKIILKEIKEAKKNAEAFGKDSKLSQYRISETGDTYLSMHQNRMIRILNEVNDQALIILYEAQVDPAEEDKEKRKRLKDEARQRAYTIANFLLNTYQTK